MGRRKSTSLGCGGGFWGDLLSLVSSFGGSVGTNHPTATGGRWRTWETLRENARGHKTIVVEGLDWANCLVWWRRRQECRRSQGRTLARTLGATRRSWWSLIQSPPPTPSSSRRAGTSKGLERKSLLQSTSSFSARAIEKQGGGSEGLLSQITRRPLVGDADKSVGGPGGFPNLPMLGGRIGRRGGGGKCRRFGGGLGGGPVR